MNSQGIGQIISVKKFNSTFTLAGGLNLPKIIDCIGSDGKLYKQLVKGIQVQTPTK
jgi:ataxia telangiectasia mutated family protein